tara:strand:- start:2243 stop:2701 length:459 start_codon:yes stop_codon:yes gene_type:complete
MPTIELTFNDLKHLPSMQIGDIAFYATPNAELGGFQNADQSDIVTIGEITDIVQTSNSVNQVIEIPEDLTEISTTTTILNSLGVNNFSFKITCDISADTTPPTETDFIFFAKDNRANMSSILGYYGAVKFKNNSEVKAEMFSAACEIDESSK